TLLGDCLFALLARIFVGFDCLGQGSSTSCDDKLHHFRVNVKGRGTLYRVQSPQTSAGSSSDVDQSAAAAQGFRNGIDSPGDLWDDAPNCRSDSGVLRVHD